MPENSSHKEGETWLLDHPNRTVIETYPSARKAHEAGLAVLAAGAPYWVYPHEGRYALVVESSRAAGLREEVRIYRMRNRFWPAVSPSLPEKQISAMPTLAFATLLVLVFLLQGAVPPLDDAGLNSSRAFWDKNEWWRVVTAITLHADAGHLLGNLFGIGLFGYFSARYLGNGLSWISIIGVGALANLTNNFIHMAGTFNSLGASTAVFAALGLVTGFPVGSYWRTGNPISSRQWVIPLSGGLMLLAWLGSGTYPTDVASHLWSFIYGLVLAAFIGGFKMHAKCSKPIQLTLLLAGWCLLAASWLLAIRTW